MQLALTESLSPGNYQCCSVINISTVPTETGSASGPANAWRDQPDLGVPSFHKDAALATAVSQKHCRDGAEAQRAGTGQQTRLSLFLAAAVT